MLVHVTPASTIVNPKLSLPIGGGLGADRVRLQELPEAVSGYIAAALADNSRRAYQGDIQDYLRWGGAVPCSPETLAAYIAARAAVHSPYTITRRVVGISRAHTSQGMPDPAKTELVRVVLRGIRRTHGKPQRQAVPLLKHDLLAILPLMTGTKGLRDRALLLLAFGAALRRSEVVALDYADIAFVSQGMIVHVRRSKTDQEGEGRRIAVPWGRTCACAVTAVQQWLEHARISSGAICRCVSKSGVIGDRLTAQSVSLIVKHYAQASGLQASEFSGHSLRSGLVTSAAQAGASTWKIKEQSGHKSDAMVARYIRSASLFEHNAAGMVL